MHHPEERLSGLSGDEAHFRRLFDRYYGPVTSFFVRRGFSLDESQDLAQETFLSVYRGIARFRGEAAFETWLFQIANNIFRNHLRYSSAARRRGLEIPLGRSETGGVGAETDEEGEVEVEDSPEQTLAASREKGPLEDVLNQEQWRLLHEALNELPSQMRRCMILRVGQGLKYREIAAVMAISIETVKSQLSQARERLKTRLADHFDDIETL